MRLWSLHPKYLDPQGLVALWRESLLAQKVLLGKTKGYTHHPQLIRFCETFDPIVSIGAYLVEIQKEATRRGYRFQMDKIEKPVQIKGDLFVTDGQVLFEQKHLIRKLKKRNPEFLSFINGKDFPEVHPIFLVNKGGIESWEIQK